MGKPKLINLGSSRKTLDEIVETSTFQPEISTFNNPEEVKSKYKDSFKLMLANTIYAGGKTDKKLFRNLLKYSQATEADALVICGNTIFIDLLKYSKYAPDRAKTSAIISNPNKINHPVYSDKDLMAVKRGEKPTYETFKERLDIAIGQLNSLFMDDGEPIYKNPVYVVFGNMEEELVRQHTNEAVRIEKIKTLNKTKQQIRAIKKEINSCNAEQKKFKEQYSVDSEEELQEKLSASKWKKYLKFENKKEELYDELDGLEHFISRISMTNTNREFIEKAQTAMTGYITNAIEKAIPNSKIISTGEGFLKIHDKKVKVMHSADKVKSAPSDNLMSKLIQTTREDLSNGIPTPDVIVAGGLSTTFACKQEAYMSHNGHESVSLIQLPTCLNANDLFLLLESKVKAGDEISKLTTKHDFNSGAVMLEYVNGIQRLQILTNDFLTNDEVFNSRFNIRLEDILRNSKFFYEVNFSDQHHGSKYVALIETKNDVLFAFDVAQAFLEEIKAPLVKYNSLGDELQEMNYSTGGEGHPEHLIFSFFEQQIKDLEKNESLDFKEKFRLLKKMAKKQDIRAGVLMPKDQRFDFLNRLNYDLMSRILENSRKIGLYGPAFNFINGNHNAHTFDGMILTSEDLAREIGIRIKANKEEIVAPVLGKSGVYDGLFGITSSGYFYGEYARHKQATSKNNDPTRGTRLAFGRRGQDYAITKGRFTINRAGHDHMGGQTMSRTVFHDKCYCFMDRNEYGEERDYPSPTIGFKINGYPVKGPANGPIITIDMPIQVLEKWANKKIKDIDTKKLFYNSVIYND